MSTREGDEVVALGVRVVFEPWRAAHESIALAYNLLVPVARRQVRTHEDSQDSEPIGSQEDIDNDRLHTGCYVCQGIV